MAKQSDGINGGYRGKVGTVVGYMWRGQWCLRARPMHFNDAKTEKQLEQRSLFKASVAFAGRVKEVLRVGLKTAALDAHKTECNYFQKINKDCFAMDGETLMVDYPNLRVSEGPVAPVAFGMPEFLEDTTLTIPFEKNPEHRRSNNDDMVYIAAFCATLGVAELSLPVYRRTGRVTIMLPASWAGQEVHLYGFVQDNASRTSNSSYIGGGELIEFVGDEGSEHLDELDLEDEGGVRRDVGAGAALAVGEVVGDKELKDRAFLHKLHPLGPTGDDLS